MVGLSFKDLLNPELDSSGFYDVLPTDRVEIDDEKVEAISWAPLFSKLSNSSFREWALEDLKNLTLLLMSSKVAHVSPENISDLARHFSLEYIKTLKEKTSEKSKKMFVQRLNFFLRALLDKDAIPPYESQCEYLTYKYPWDWIKRGDETIFIVSEEKNVIHLKSNALQRSLRLGLPTQVDEVDGNWFSVGSQFSNGAFLLGHEEVQHLPHDNPVPLAFIFKDELHFLDIKGNLHSKNSGKIMGLDLANVSRVRKYGSHLIIMDWTHPFSLHIFELEANRLSSVSFEEVFIPNDVFMYQGDYFIIDKQQGYLFQFNARFELKKRLLSFGRGPGKLFDPAAIRLSQDNQFLEILNWVPSSVSTIPVHSLA